MVAMLETGEESGGIRGRDDPVTAGESRFLYSTLVLVSERVKGKTPRVGTGGLDRRTYIFSILNIGKNTPPHE